MTTAAIRSPRIRTGGRLGCWLSVRHSLRAEAAGALTLYGLYELARGLVGADSTRLGNGLGGHNGCLVLGRG
jgi:hypothetical protein